MIKRNLHKLDATDQAVGRLASKIALILRGKNKPEYQPYIDNGDIVEVENINNLKFTGKKLEQKKYYRYSGYPGGLKADKMIDLKNNKPGLILKKAVREMLPPTKLRDGMLKRLKIK